MANTKRDWDFLTQEQRTAAIHKIIDFYNSELEEDLGMIGAETILDMFLETVGSQIYNKGVVDANTLFKDRSEQIEVDVNMLLKKE